MLSPPLVREAKNILMEQLIYRKAHLLIRLQLLFKAHSSKQRIRRVIP